MSLSKYITSYTIIFMIVCILNACKNDTPDPMPKDDFNRSEMLRFWAEEIIIPSFDNYDLALQDLQSAKNDFVNHKSLSNLELLRASWLRAYKAWQHVSMFDIGKAEEIQYRNFVNIYPADTSEINFFVQSGEYDLTLPSTYDAQGFPALDYLLYGLSDDESETLNYLSQDSYTNYLTSLIDRMKLLNTEVLSDWKNNFKNEFIENDASSATASTDKLANDYLYYYERFFRAGKIGIPVGIFSGSALIHTVEAPYSAVHSKELFLESFYAIQNFFNGQSFDNEAIGLSLKQYLNHIQQANNSAEVTSKILNQWALIEAASSNVSGNFKEQILKDNSKMLIMYDEIQKAVIFLKVDMMQALNIQVDFVDADGD